MSGIYGVYGRDGGVDARFGVLAQAMRYWRPDASGEWSGPFAALGCLATWNTPEARLDRLPRIEGGDDDRLVIVADARLDNRDELLGRLAHRVAGDPATVTDSELLLAAYREWGDASPAELLGDFAYAIWDAARGSLFLARDALGIKPLYYRMVETGVAFANDMRGLAGEGRELDVDSLALYLREGELFHREKTFLAGVHKLPPASTLRVGPDGVARSTYWSPEDAPRLRFDSVAECAAQLRNLLDDAVRVRLRTDNPVVTHLSGGLDSSVISVLAARRLQPGGPSLHGVNWLQPPGPGDDPESVEWAPARTVAQAADIPFEETSLDVQDVCRHLAETDLAEHTTVDGWYEAVTLARARSLGAKTILSGWGGDELISYSGRRSFTGLFWSGRVVAALRGIGSSRPDGANRTKRFFAACYRELLRPMWQRLRGHRSEPVALDFAGQPIHRAARRLPAFVYSGSALSARGEQLAVLGQDHLQNRTESWANAARPHGIEYCYPLLDRRVVEFALGVPAEYYRGPATNRRLFREVARGLLPEAVRLNRSKADPARVLRLLELLCAGLNEWLETHLEVDDDAGLVDKAALEQAIRRLQQGGAELTPAHIRHVQALEKSARVVTAASRHVYNK